MYDLVLKGGTVVDPFTGLDGVYDIAVQGPMISCIAPDIPSAEAISVLERREGDWVVSDVLGASLRVTQAMVPFVTVKRGASRRIGDRDHGAGSRTASCRPAPRQGAAADGISSPGPSDARWIAAAGAFVTMLDSMMNIAFPAIATAFAVPPDAMRWVIMCYVFTYAFLSFAAGALADRIGHARVF